jgi:hypothetical protein
MTSECSRRRKLTQAMPDHVLRNVNWDKFLSVMYSYRQADEIRSNHRRSRPRLDHDPLIALIDFLDLLLQFGVNIRSFFS